MIALENLRIQLAQEERDILRGRQGPILQKVMETVVLYGEALGAERLVDIERDGHFVVAYAIPGIAPSMEMLDELLAAGLKTKFPFTLDPKPPLDFENWWLRPEQVQILEEMYQAQPLYEKKLLQLGLCDPDAWTCTPYLPQVGNVPKRGDTLAWSESACAIFANSVLGARTNKNGAIMDLLCGIVGKTPLAGLLTAEGRRATWLIEINTEKLPPPQLLGAAVGLTVLADVPFIAGLDRFLGPGLSTETRDYLHEMGAACATTGAVGLFHVENITPEAIDCGRGLLIPNHKAYAIDDQQLRDLLASYPVMWEDKDADPEKCFIGCPHLSLEQLYWWAAEISSALETHGRRELAVKTTLCAAPQVLREFKADKKVWERLESAGAKFSAGCPMQLFDNDLSAGEAIVTNSNKLRAYTTARFLPDEELVEILVRGEKVNRSLDLIERDHAAVASTIYRYTDVAFQRGAGVYLYDFEGHQYLDFAAGIATLSVGHCHPAVVEAICDQARTLVHGACHVGYMEPYVEMLEALKAVAPGELRQGKGILVNSGSEAVETGIKLARYVTKRPMILAFTGSFHGRSMGALSLTASSPTYRQRLTGLLTGVYHTPYPYCYRCPLKHESPETCGLACLNLVEQALQTIVPPQDLAGIVVEPIAGEGGYIVPPDGFLQGLRDICDRYGALLIADEVQTGLGRTGKMFAVEHWGVVPDVLCLAKALGGGLPLGAMLTRADLADAWPPAAQGTTFGGNPVACRAGLATLRIIQEENLMAHAVEVGDYIRRRFHKAQGELPLIGDVRGKGLMVGVELINVEGSPAGKVVKTVLKESRASGLVLTKCGASTLRFAPPLIITQEQARKGADIVLGILGRHQW